MTKNEYKKWYDQAHKGDLHYWVTKQYGRMKGRASKKNKEQCGTMAKNYWSKPILQYDSNMNFIAKFASTREAGRILGYDNSGIARACRLHKLYKGYRWEYE